MGWASDLSENVALSYEIKGEKDTNMEQTEVIMFQIENIKEQRPWDMNELLSALRIEKKSVFLECSERWVMRVRYTEGVQ